MAEHYKFFDSSPGDIREYTASQFTDYFARFLDDGVYTDKEIKTMGLKVEVVNGFNIKVGKGYALIDGKDYENDADINITLDGADNILDRIDRLVVRLDITNKKINTVLKKGNLGSQPTKPGLTYNASIKEIPLASLRVSKGSTTPIITDERVPVSSLIEIPYEDMVTEFNQWFEGVKNSIGVEVYYGKDEPTNMVAGDLWFKEVE